MGSELNAVVQKLTQNGLSTGVRDRRSKNNFYSEKTLKRPHTEEFWLKTDLRGNASTYIFSNLFSNDQRRSYNRETIHERR